MSEKIDFLNLFKYKLNLNPWTYKNVIYIFGICAPRRWIWVLLEVCTTTRTKTVKRKSSVLRKLRQDVWRDKTFVRSCIVQSWDIDVTERVRTCLSCIYSCFKLGKTVGSNYIRSILQQANPSVQLFYFKNLWDSSKLNRTEAVMHLVSGNSTLFEI